MHDVELAVAREAKFMTRIQVLMMAIRGEITWLQAADIEGMTPRHMRRLRRLVERIGLPGLIDGRGGKPRRKRLSVHMLRELCRLKEKEYPDYSIQHFYEQVTGKHGFKLSYTSTRRVLQEAGLVAKAPGRGKYRRKRERRPLVGMMLHLDASTHPWLPGLPDQDLVVMLDDADGRILYARFVEQEGTRSTLEALQHVLTHYGRFSELYTDRGSHFCRTAHAGEAPTEEQNGQVARALRALGIRQILARSPEARGRSERAFGTIQGRLPQELRVAGVRSYAEANRYLEVKFIADFNVRFTVTPARDESAFVSIAGLDLRLLLSTQHERVVRNDSTVVFQKINLQLPRGVERTHYVRCPVLIHELLDGHLAVTHQGKVLAEYTGQGVLRKTRPQPSTPAPQVTSLPPRPPPPRTPSVQQASRAQVGSSTATVNQ